MKAIGWISRAGARTMWLHDPHVAIEMTESQSEEWRRLIQEGSYAGNRDVNFMAPRAVSRADIVATLQARQQGELNAEQVWAWAEARFLPGIHVDDWEGDSSVAREVLLELDNLPPNLGLPEDIPLHLEFLETPAGHFETGYRQWRAALNRIDWKERRLRLRNQPPYARFCS